MKFAKIEQAIKYIKTNYSVPKQHHAAHAEVKTAKEYFILRMYLQTLDQSLPIEINHLGAKHGFPDFTIKVSEQHTFVEVTEITDRQSQEIYQKKTLIPADGYGTIDLTPSVRERIENKNQKHSQYMRNTNTTRSALLLYYNKYQIFEYGSEVDYLDITDICSPYNEIMLLGINNNETNQSYLKLK